MDDLKLSPVLAQVLKMLEENQSEDVAHLDEEAEMLLLWPSSETRH